MQQKVNKSCIFADIGRCECLRVVEFGCRHNECKFFKTLGQQIYDEQRGRELLGDLYKSMKEVKYMSYVDNFKGSDPIALVKYGEIVEEWDSLESCLNWHMWNEDIIRDRGYEIRKVDLKAYKAWIRENEDG